MQVCSLCNQFGGPSFGAVLRHIGEIHRYDPGLHIRCGINRCPQTYCNFESFRSHVYRKHQNELHTTCEPTNPMTDVESVYNDELIPSVDNDELIPLNFVTPNPQMIGAKFILKIREEYRISQRTLNNVVSDVKGLWMSSISDSIKHYCQKYESPIDPLMDCIKDNLPLFETEYLQQ